MVDGTGETERKGTRGGRVEEGREEERKIWDGMQVCERGKRVEEKGTKEPEKEEGKEENEREREGLAFPMTNKLQFQGDLLRMTDVPVFATRPLSCFKLSIQLQ